MPRNPAIRTYCQQVRRGLELPWRHKRQLLEGLERELEEQFSSAEEITAEDLYERAGSPEDVTMALMEGIDEKDRAQYRAQRKLLVRAVLVTLIAMLIVLVVGSAAYFSYLVQHGVDHIEVRVVQDGTEEILKGD